MNTKTTVVIPQKTSGSGTIYDIESQHYEREITFHPRYKYAIVLASFYGDVFYLAETEDTCIRRIRKDLWRSGNRDSFSFEVIDRNGKGYDLINGELIENYKHYASR